MTASGKIFAARSAMVVLLLACLAFVSSCERRPVVEEDIRRDATVRAIEQVIPSVVNIATAKEVIPYQDFQDIFGRSFRQYFSQPQEVPNSVGSGVIIDEEGYVLTSRHVVENTSRIQVQLWDGRLYDCDGLVGTIFSDVALLKIRAKPGEKFKVIGLAHDDDVLLGETVLALGDPLALGGTVTKGILSSKTRRLPMENGPLFTKDWLQTDAAINNGNSGGPLINLRGEMIGLNEATATNSQNIGFAIPVKQVQAAISQFFTPEVMNSLWFGARVRAGSGPLRTEFVQPNSPAEKAGLRVGDEIVEVNGRTPTDAIGFNHDLCGPVTNQNLQVTLLVQRSNQRSTLTVQMISFESLIRQKMGLALHKPTPQEASGLKIPASILSHILYIDQVQADSPAGRVQIQPGIYLAGIDNRPTPNLRELADILSTRKMGDPMKLTVVVQQLVDGKATYTQGTVDIVTR